MKDFASRVATGDLESPLEMEQSNLFGIFTESFDMMREELKASRTRETELKRKEKELVAELSHDLKTPITGIDSICDVLHLKVQDPYVLGKVEGIQKKTQQMELLVSDLLTAALDDLGEMTVNCTDESSEILHDIIKAADTRSLVRESAVPECMLHIDAKRMQQVIGNIVGNSYKYKGSGWGDREETFGSLIAKREANIDMVINEKVTYQKDYIVEIVCNPLLHFFPADRESSYRDMELYANENLIGKWRFSKAKTDKVSCKLPLNVIKQSRLNLRFVIINPADLNLSEIFQVNEIKIKEE